MSLALQLLMAFFLLCGVGALLACFVPERWNPAVLAVVGALAAVVAVALGAGLLMDDAAFQITLWPLLNLGALTLGGDELSGFFLIVTGLVFLPASIYSAHYLVKYLDRYSLRYFAILYHVLFASIVLILFAADALSFLLAWETMSIASYLLINFDDEQADAAQAAFVMVAMSEAGTIAVAIAFMLAAGAAGVLDFPGLRTARGLSDGVRWSIFLLSFFGFAVKAGLVPVNSWLALAHPVAPTNISALLSAVIVNLGVYGIIRMNLDIAPPEDPGPGVVVLVIGSASALVGILYATIQSEMKRILAHSTIENMGIVASGVGAAMIFLASGHRTVAAIALVAALYHLGNHSIYKALLFLGTGAVEAKAGSRDLDRLGGVARNMPWTSALFLVGVMAISALPPLNGFVSEWLTLQTILRSTLLASTSIKIVFAIAGALLALTAGLAVTCFVKMFAMGFLGMPRSDAAARAAEAPLGTRGPMALLAAICVLLGLLPTYVIPSIDQAVTPLAHASATSALIPPFFDSAAQSREALPDAFLAEFHDLGAQVGGGQLPGRGLVVLHRGERLNPVVFAMSTSYTCVVLAGIMGLVFLIVRLLSRKRSLARGAVWAGGLRELRPEITYTATGFSNPVRVVFDAVLRPADVGDATEAVAQHFRTAIRRERQETHIVDRFVLGPPVQGLRRLAATVRKLHIGHVNAYAAYVLVTLVAVLLIGMTIR